MEILILQLPQFLANEVTIDNVPWTLVLEIGVEERTLILQRLLATNGPPPWAPTEITEALSWFRTSDYTYNKIRDLAEHIR